MKTEKASELYQEIVLEHSKSPHNYGKLHNPTHFAEGYNQLCGDDIDIYLKVDDNQIIEDISFTGDTSALTKASTSLMTVHLKGKTIPGAKELYGYFIDLMNGVPLSEAALNILGELALLEQTRNYSGKVQCATLGWYTFHGALKGQQIIQT